jgi:hypothetical protein
MDRVGSQNDCISEGNTIAHTNRTVIKSGSRDQASPYFTIIGKILKMSLFLFYCCARRGVHCGIYKSSYNISNIAY